ncbi:hypothetical protein GIB67_035494 [Kingdonia uniflora]|uniref:F-box domain-containing protein n=1 Tax=Kingdonia uniflora TaxID=39325 RepID=A0A7J7P0U1_9MAGN|nr:hypothetical protein GIB67_035494 [Kingdonia uniflora]
MELIPGLPNDVARECLIRVPYNHFSSIPSVSKTWKQEVESEQFHQMRKTSGLSRTVIAMVQAETKTKLGGPAAKYVAPAYWLTLYEPETGAWSRLPAIPGYPNGMPLFCQCVSVGQSIVVIGGWNPLTWEVLKVVYVYDFISATWRRGADMSGPSRSFFACVSDSTRTVFVAGGHDQDKNALSSALAYNVAEDKWVHIADMEKQRDECTGIFTSGKFYVIGGYSSDMQGRFMKSAEAFDAVTCTWDQVNDDFMETGTCPKTCAATENGAMYRCSSGNVEVLDNGNPWRKIAEVPEDVRVGLHLVTWQDKVLVTGSDRCGGLCNSYVLEFVKAKAKELRKWEKIETPHDFKGHVQVGFSLDI